MARVDVQILDAEVFLSLSGRASQQRAHTREEFGKGERLHQVIVRPELETFHAITHAVACREKKNRRARLLTPNLTTHFPAVLPRQHYIDNEQIERSSAREPQPAFSIAGCFDVRSEERRVGKECRS